MPELKSLAIKKAAELEDELKKERIRVNFWASECDQAEKRFAYLLRAVGENDDIEEIRKAARTIVSRFETARALYETPGRTPKIIRIDEKYINRNREEDTT